MSDPDPYLEATLALAQQAQADLDELMNTRIEVEMDALNDPRLHRQLHLLSTAFAAADDNGHVPPSDQDLDIRKARYRYHAVTAVAVARMNVKRGIQ